MTLTIDLMSVVLQNIFILCSSYDYKLKISNIYYSFGFSTFKLNDILEII